MSRNRYIIRALQQMVEAETRWSTTFVEQLEAARSDEEGREALEELMSVVTASRTRKGPPVL